MRGSLSDCDSVRQCEHFYQNARLSALALSRLQNAILGALARIPTQRATKSAVCETRLESGSE